MQTNEYQVGKPSPKTEKNIKQARARSLWCGPVHVEWKFYTGNFLFRPRWDTMTTEFWNEGPVRWFRAYWLTMGLSIYRLLPERRVKQDMHNLYLGEGARRWPSVNRRKT